MIRVEADFNEIFDDDYIWVSVRRIPEFGVQQLQPGDWAELYDEDGLRCWGIVATRVGPILTFKIDRSTWQSQSVSELTYNGSFLGGRPFASDPDHPVTSVEAPSTHKLQMMTSGH